MSRRSLIRMCLLALLFCMQVVPFSSSSLRAQPEYPETISVLQKLYFDEILALHKYAVYAQKVESENYPDIAKLFFALAASESIHARNFKQLLSGLGVEVKEIQKPEIEVFTTRKNLEHACNVELEEIDNRYPDFIKKVEQERHAEAILKITYAWESEKQHRDLIQKIRSGTGFLFSFLVKQMKEPPSKYLVGQNCGSTLTELPKKSCPICGSSISSYSEIGTSNPQ